MKAKAIHKAHAEDYKIWKTAEDGCKKLIRVTVDEVYINELKDGTTFFHKVFARDLLEHLKKNSSRLHALDNVKLYLNMLLLYKNAASMPDFILAMEEVQKKAKCAGLPILDIKLAMYTATAILQSGNYKKETDEWEGRNTAMKTWSEWKQAYLTAYARGVNRQREGATDKPFSQAANLVTLPATHDVMDAFAGLLDALMGTTDRTTVQQLTSANLLLTTSVATLMAANKKLNKTVARYNPAPQGCSGGRGRGGNNVCHGPKVIWGNYCWAHEYKVLHTSKIGNVIGRKLGHNEDAMVAGTKAGADFNKD